MKLSRRLFLQSVGLAAVTPAAGGEPVAPIGAQRASIIFAGVGDGVTDDSSAWNTFIGSCMLLGARGIVRPGHYRVPHAAAVSVTGDLVLTGDGGATKPIIDGERAGAKALFRLTNKSFVMHDIIFRNFSDILTAGDGTNTRPANTVTGDIEAVSLRRVEFQNCRRPAFAFVSKTGPTLGKFEFMDCVVDGQATGWCGVFWGWTNMLSARADRNAIKNIDATAAGYGSGGSGPPANVGNGRAILLGGNNPAADYAWRGWSADDNIIENVTDSRAKQKGVNPEVGAIRMTGVSYATICRNRISNVRSIGIGVDDDCEAIYPKIRHGIINDNTLTDSGINGSAIVLKGYNRAGNGLTDHRSNPSAYGYAGICSGNRIVNTTGLSAGGVSNYSSDWVVDGNYIQGCGGLSVELEGGGRATRFAPLWSNASQADNIAFTNNMIVDAIGQFGIVDGGYGKDHRIEGNTIDGVLASISGLPTDQRTVGILITNANGNGFNTDASPLADMSVANNKVGRLVAASGQTTVVLAANSGGSSCDRMRIEGNLATTAADVAVWISGGTFNGLQIKNNDWSLTSDDYLQTGNPKISNQDRRGNNG